MQNPAIEWYEKQLDTAHKELKSFSETVSSEEISNNKAAFYLQEHLTSQVKKYRMLLREAKEMVFIEPLSHENNERWADYRKDERRWILRKSINKSVKYLLSLENPPDAILITLNPARK